MSGDFEVRGLSLLVLPLKLGHCAEGHEMFWDQNPYVHGSELGSIGEW